MEECSITDDCPNDNCAETSFSCTRTCLNGEFGVAAACASGDETKTKTCPAVACGKFQ